jgi:hypothetical protein
MIYFGFDATGDSIRPAIFVLDCGSRKSQNITVSAYLARQLVECLFNNRLYKRLTSDASPATGNPLNNLSLILATHR